MHIERLTELRNMLQSIPEELFDLIDWTSSTDLFIHNKTQNELIGCGTVCCAIGWACSHHPFNEQGLQWLEMTNGVRSVPCYNDKTGYYAICDFFEISVDTVIWLFSVDSYEDENATIQEVIARIDSLIMDK